MAKKYFGVSRKDEHKEMHNKIDSSFSNNDKQILSKEVNQGHNKIVGKDHIETKRNEIRKANADFQKQRKSYSNDKEWNYLIEQRKQERISEEKKIQDLNFRKNSELSVSILSFIILILLIVIYWIWKKKNER